MSGRGRPFDLLPMLLMASVVAWLAYTRQSFEGPLAEISARSLLDLSPGLVWSLALLLGAALLVVAGAAAVLGGSRRPILAFHVLCALLLSAKLFLTPELALPRAAGGEVGAELAMTVVATRIAALSKEGRLPDDAQSLERALAGLPPPWEGEEQWRIEPAECRGPEDLPETIELGVAVYCLSPDAAFAWLAWSAGGADGPSSAEEGADPFGDRSVRAYLEGVTPFGDDGELRRLGLRPMR